MTDFLLWATAIAAVAVGLFWFCVGREDRTEEDGGLFWLAGLALLVVFSAGDFLADLLRAALR